MKQIKGSMRRKQESLSNKNEDRRRKDRYGHSARRFTVNDLSLIPDIKITKIIPPTMDDMEKCNMSRNGKLSVLFSVDGENFKLNYNPTISGYDGLSALAREKCSITNLDTGTVYDCTGAYSIPWLDNPEKKFIFHQRLEPVVQAYMNPTEQMVLTQFIKPFAKDYLGKDATESKQPESKKNEDISSRIQMGIDYKMFKRMCSTAAYLTEDEDYWDALWDYYSEGGPIADAFVFFDNLFQYTEWCDVDELYEEYLDDKFKDESKSREECIQAAIDEGDLQAYKHESGNYLVIL